jgi:hypothetical protein
VRVNDDIFVRAAYGSGSSWYGVAQASRQAHVSAGGVQRDVAVEDADGSVVEQVDAAYRKKYGSRYASIVDDLVKPANRVNTNSASRSNGRQLMPDAARISDTA